MWGACEDARHLYYDERTLYNFIRPRACCGLVSVAGSFFILSYKTKVS
nr:MAG TPA: hypothetical protein [Caudoviricetes sp.]